MNLTVTMTGLLISVFGLFLTFAIVLGTAIAAFFMLVFMINDQTESYIEQEEENARLRAELMLSQLKPHFLYNTLATIGYLCNDSPEAKEAIINFAGYLRENMNSLNSDGFSTYEKELEHTRLYLELEQLRFGDDLKVVYDLQCPDFQLPMLTLQPIAENSVGHGIRESRDGTGTVTITSREYEDRYEIVVSDDGVGFSPDKPLDDNESHIGINNVRERLKLMSHGELDIISAPGKGCEVHIIVPK